MSLVFQMIRWLGFKKVFLVGCDFGGDNKLSKLSSNYIEKGQQQNLIDGINLLRMESRKGGVEYISCTEGSPINEFLTYKTIGHI